MNKFDVLEMRMITGCKKKKKPIGGAYITL